MDGMETWRHDPRRDRAPQPEPFASPGPAWDHRSPVVPCRMGTPRDDRFRSIQAPSPRYRPCLPGWTGLQLCHGHRRLPAPATRQEFGGDGHAVHLRVYRPEEPCRVFGGPWRVQSPSHSTARWLQGLFRTLLQETGTISLRPRGGPVRDGHPACPPLVQHYRRCDVEGARLYSEYCPEAVRCL